MANPTAIEKELYPLSAEDSTAIPLEVIRPLALIKGSVTASGNTSITIPVGWKIATFYASVGCFVEFNAATLPTPPVIGTPYPDVLFLPAGIMLTSTVLEGAARIVSADGFMGYIIAQQIQKWTAKALARQVSKV